MEVVVLAGRVEDGEPEFALEVDLLAFDDGERNRDERVGSAVVDVADDAVGASGHCRVDGGAREHVAADGVGADGRDAADGVAGVEVLDGGLDALGLEVRRDPLFEELADVLLEDVAGGVARFGFAGDQVLPGALGDDDDGMVLRGKAPLQRGEKPVDILACNTKGACGDVSAFFRLST